MLLTVERAGQVIRAGGVVVYPTETLWGIGGSALQPGIALRVRRIKEIREPRPLPVLAESAVWVRSVLERVPDGFESLAAAFWPGGLTMVLAVADDRFGTVAGRGGTVGFRLSAHAVAQALTRAAGGFLVSTSANVTGSPPPAGLGEVEDDFLAQTDGAVEWDGVCGGEPSTVIEHGAEGWEVLREGAVSHARIERVLVEAGVGR
jgi:L-threonylcarbamoyladenylate synthase